MKGEMKLKCNYVVLIWGVQETPGNLVSCSCREWHEADKHTSVKACSVYPLDELIIIGDGEKTMGFKP